MRPYIEACRRRIREARVSRQQRAELARDVRGLQAVFSQFQHESAQFPSNMTVVAQELGTDDQTSEN